MKHVNELYDDINELVVFVCDEYLNALEISIYEYKLKHKLEVLNNVDSDKSLYQYIAEDLFENDKERKVCENYIRYEIEKAGYKVITEETKRVPVKNNKEVVGEIIYVNYYITW